MRATTFEGVLAAIASEEEARTKGRRWNSDDSGADRAAIEQARRIWADVMLEQWVAREPWIEADLAQVRAAQRELVKREFGATNRKPVRNAS